MKNTLFSSKFHKIILGKERMMKIHSNEYLWFLFLSLRFCFKKFLIFWNLTFEIYLLMNSINLAHYFICFSRLWIICVFHFYFHCFEAISIIYFEYYVFLMLFYYTNDIIWGATFLHFATRFLFYLNLVLW